MSDQKVEVEFSARTEGVEKGAAEASKAVESSVGRMGQALAGASDAAKEMQSKFTTSMEGMKTTASDFVGHFGVVGKAIAAVGALLAGGAIFKNAIDQTMEFAAESNKLARQLGMTASEASIMNIALGDVFLTAEQAGDAAAGLARQVRTNEGALKEMGLRTREANGELRPTADLMRDAGKMVGEYREGMDRTIATTQLFGRGVSDSGIALKLAAVDMDAAREKAGKLGLVITQENVTANKHFKDTLNDVGDVMLGIKKAIGDALIPILTKLGEWFAEVGPAAVWVTKEAIGFLGTAFWSLKNGIVVVWETINAMVVSVAEPILSVGRAIYKLAHGDIAGAAEEMTGMPGRIADAWTKAGDEMLRSSEETAARIDALFGEGHAVEAKPTTGKTAKVKDKDAESIVTLLEQELEDTRRLIAQRTAINRDGLQLQTADEAAYWENALNITGLTEKEKTAIRKHATAANMKLLHEGFDEELSVFKRETQEAGANAAIKAEIAAREAEKIAGWYGRNSKQFEAAELARVTAAQAASDQIALIAQKENDTNAKKALAAVDAEQQMQALSLTLHQTTLAEQLKNEEQFEQRRQQIRSTALQANLALVDPQRDPVRYADILAQIEALELAHDKAMRGIKVRASVEDRKYQEQFFGGMEHGFASVLKHFATGTMTVQALFANMGRVILSSMVDVFAAIAAEWLAKQVMMMIFGKAAAISDISSSIARAGAGGTASMAGAPFPMNLGAPAFGLAMAGLAASYTVAAAASQGFDIPAGLNPITQLHEKEMVLPAKHADVIREIADGGGGSRQDGAMHVTIHAIDAASVKRLFESNGSALGSALRRQARNFAQNS